MGTRRAKISGPETSGSEGLNGIPLTRDAPFNSGRLPRAGTLSWYTKSFSFLEELCLKITLIIKSISNKGIKENALNFFLTTGYIFSKIANLKIWKGELNTLQHTNIVKLV